jgi:FMN phosphatase YigB (HAD superfamily)
VSPDSAGPAPLALFGLDNTLLDRARGFRSWARSFLRSVGLDVPGALDWLVDADNDGRTPRDDLFSLVVLRFGLEATPDALVARYGAELPAHVRVDDDVAVALRLLRTSGWRIGVVARGDEVAERTLRRSGLAGLVDGWAVDEADGHREHDRARCALAATRAGAALDDGREVWVVGDDPIVHIGAGRDLGATTVWLHRERTWELTAYRPSSMVTSVPEAVTLMVDPEVHLPAAFR